MKHSVEDEFTKDNIKEDEVNFQFDEKQFNQSFDEEFEKMNEELTKEVKIAMIGDVNTGKSSTINKIMGDQVAPVGSQPGETVNVNFYTYKDKIIFADTPGLDDIKSENSQETIQFHEEADVILFFLNAAGTVLSEGERRNLDQIKAMNDRIILVLNKIDAADDVANIVNYVRENTNGEFDVVPISSKTGENIDKLRNKILDILKKVNKEVQFARHVQGDKNRSSIANKWILAAAGSASAVGAAPIPGSDIVPITGIQVGLMIRLATLYDKPLSKETAKEFALATFTGNIGKSIFRQVVKIIPGAGSIAGAGIAGSMTFALGHAIKYAYENDMDLNIDTFKRLYEIYRKKDQS